MPPRAARFAHTVHVSALGVWLGALILAGASAAIIFPVSKSLDLRMPAYEGYTGEHWRLAAGMIQARIFTALDFIQLIACTVAIATLAYVLFKRHASGRAVSIVRVGTLLLLLLSLIGQLFFMHPPMDTALLSYWEAARGGDNVKAAEHYGAFEKFHGPASVLMAFDAALVLIALAVGAWTGLGQAVERRP